jgi:hypothetical protein
MTIQSDPNGEHLVNGFSWPFVKNHFRAKGRANGADPKKVPQENGIAQACLAILQWMSEIDELNHEFYTVEEAFQKLIGRLPEIEIQSTSGDFTKHLNETYNELRRMVAPLQDLKQGTYYRTASGMLARVTRVHSTPMGTNYYGIIFDKDTNLQGVWNQLGCDRTLPHSNNLLYESSDQRSLRVLLNGIEACLEAYNEPIADEDTEQYIEEAQKLTAVALGRVED